MNTLDPKDRPTYAELADRVAELEHQLAMALAQVDNLRELLEDVEEKTDD